MSWSLSVDAADQSVGMTLAELDAFVMRAKLVGSDPGDVLQARVTVRGKVKRLSLAAPSK